MANVCVVSVWTQNAGWGLPDSGTTPSCSGLFWTSYQGKCLGEAARGSILESGILSEHYFALRKVSCHGNAAEKARLPGACSSAYKVKLRYRWNIPPHSWVQLQHKTPQHFPMPLKLLNRPMGIWILFESCLFPYSHGLCQFIFPLVATARCKTNRYTPSLMLHLLECN